MVEPPFTIKSYWVTGDVNVQLLILEPADNINTQSPLPFAPSANFAVILYPPPLTVTPSGITKLAGTVTLLVNVYDDPVVAVLKNTKKLSSHSTFSFVVALLLHDVVPIFNVSAMPLSLPSPLKSHVNCPGAVNAVSPTLHAASNVNMPACFKLIAKPSSKVHPSNVASQYGI